MQRVRRSPATWKLVCVLLVFFFFSCLIMCKNQISSCECVWVEAGYF